MQRLLQKIVERHTVIMYLIVLGWNTIANENHYDEQTVNERIYNKHYSSDF